MKSIYPSFIKEKKLIVSIMFTGISAVLFFVSFSSVAHAATFYFCDGTGNHNPATTANYKSASDCSGGSPGVVPDFSVDEVTVVAGATFDNDGNGTYEPVRFNGGATNEGIVTGDGSFYDSASNNGTVAGDAIFYDDFTENTGTVTGVKYRRYTIAGGNPAYPARDFVTDGPWTIVADGVDVDLNALGSTLDETVTLTAVNGGTFTYVALIAGTGMNSTLFIEYNKTLDTGSVPDASDFEVQINGVVVDVTNTAISGKRVVLTLESNIEPNDTVTLDYTPGSNPVNSLGDNVDSLSGQQVHVGLPVGSDPYAVILVNNKIYVANTASSNITVLNAETRTIVTTIPLSLPGGPNYVAQVGYKLYFTDNGSKVSVIDTQTDTLSSYITVGTGSVYPIAVGRKVYVANGGTDEVTVIDSETDTITTTISVGDRPFYMTQIGSKIYVTNIGSDNVSVIDSETDTVTSTISVGDGPFYSFALGDKLYVSHQNGSVVKVIDSTTDAVVSTLTVGGSGGQYISAVGTKVYVANSTSDNVSVIDATTNSTGGTVVASFSVGDLPSYLFSFNGRMYIANQGSGGDLSIVDVNQDYDSVSDTLLGDGVYAFATYGNDLYYTNLFSRNTSIIDTTSVPSLLPNLISFTSSTASGTYSEGNHINITANFGKTLQNGSTMTVTLNTGDYVVLNAVSGTTLQGTYIVGSGDKTPDLSVVDITSANVTDTDLNNRTNYSIPYSSDDLIAERSMIARNIGDSKDIIIAPYITVSTGDNPYQISGEVTVDGIGYIYVANQGDATVSVIRTSDNTVIRTINVGDEPYGLATVSLSGVTYVYVANTGSDTVSVIRTSDNTVIDTVDVGVKPYYVAVVGTKVYVTNSYSNTVSVINALTNTVIETVDIGIYPRGIKAHGTDLYVANYGDLNYGGGNSISVIDSTHDTVSDTIVLPGTISGPRGVTVYGDYVYVTNYRSHNVSVINTATNAVTATIEVGQGPRGILANDGKIYVENFDDGTISIISTTNNTVIDTVYVGHSPAGMGLVGSDIYISSFQSNKLFILDTSTGLLKQETPSSRSSSGSTRRKMIPVSDPFMPVPASSDPVELSAFIPFNRPLSLTDSGVDVKTLQQFLISKNYLAPDKATGYFGPLTKAALVSFQAANNITPSTGNFGPLTKALVEKLIDPQAPAGEAIPNTSSNFTRNLSIGMTGEDVKKLQQFLNTHGYIIVASGAGSPGNETDKFGSLTKAALMKFQKDNAIAPVSGYFGPVTRNKVNQLISQ